mmetsp:Transcript_23812/g.52453  ORF Transcript_23812/g.52453 Transcript_23812/m.52453 type:complete len:763 (+) Transcript_23812:1026-3314(+)
MLLHDRLYNGLVLGLDVGQDQPLVAGHPKLADVPVSQLAQALLLATSHTALLDVNAQVVAGGVLHPADGVRALGEFKGSGGLELGTQQVLHLSSVPINAVVVDGVLQACMLAVAPAPMVTLHRDDHLRHVFCLVLLDEPQHGPEPGKRRAIIVGVAQAPADDDVEALQLVVLNDSDEPNIVGVDVHVVVRGDSHSHLEFTGEVGPAVQRLLLEGSAAADLVLLVRHGVVQDEDLVPGAGLGKAVVVDLLGVVHALIHQRRRRGHRIAGAANHPRDVPAGRNRIHACALDHSHALNQVVLLDPLQLPCLTSRDLQVGLAEGGGNLIDSTPLRSVAITCRLPHTNHEAESVLQTQSLTLRPHVPVILLVDTVVLDHHLIGLGDAARGSVAEGGGQGTAEVVGVILGLLGGLVWRLVRRRSRIVTSLEAHGLAQLLLPRGEPRPVPICVLLIRDSDVQQRSPAQVHQLLMQPPPGSSKMLRLRPVLAVAKGKRGESKPLHVLLPALQVLPEPSAVRGKLALAGGARHEQHEPLQRSVLGRVHGLHLHGPPCQLDDTGHLAGTLLGVSRVRGIQNSHLSLRRRPQTSGQGTSSALSALPRHLLLLLHKQDQLLLALQKALNNRGHGAAVGSESLLRARVVPVQERPLVQDGDEHHWAIVIAGLLKDLVEAIISRELTPIDHHLQRGHVRAWMLHSMYARVLVELLADDHVPGPRLLFQELMQRLEGSLGVVDTHRPGSLSSVPLLAGHHSAAELRDALPLGDLVRH